MTTNLRKKLYLIDHDESQIIGAKLPSNGQVLRVLFYNLHKVKLNLRSSANLVVKEVEIMWNKARIPIKGTDKSIIKVESLYSEWKKLLKSSKRQSTLQEKREKEFIGKLDDLFDIAILNALDEMKIEEDKLFLLNQRMKGRPGSMGGADCVLLRSEQKKVLRKEEEKRRLEIYEAKLYGMYENKNANCNCKW